MKQPAQHYTDEQTGISYTLSPEGYYLPDLTLPDEPEYDIGRFGMMRHNYLKKHRRILFINLLTTCKLNEHLYEIDQTANERFELISRQMAQTEGVTEQLKSENQMLWVRKMNGIRNPKSLPPIQYGRLVSVLSNLHTEFQRWGKKEAEEMILLLATRLTDLISPDKGGTNGDNENLASS